MLSDSDSSDSDSGIRFKTASTRDKFDAPPSSRLPDRGNGANRSLNDHHNGDRDRRDRERDRRDHREPRRDPYGSSSNRRERRSESRDRKARRSSSRDRSARTTTTHGQRGASTERRRDHRGGRDARDNDRKSNHQHESEAKRDRKSGTPNGKRVTTSKEASAEIERSKQEKIKDVVPVEVRKSSKERQKSIRAASPQPLVTNGDTTLDKDSSKPSKHQHKKHKRTRSKERTESRPVDDKRSVSRSDTKSTPRESKSKSAQREVCVSVSPKREEHISAEMEDLSCDSVSICGPQLPPHLVKSPVKTSPHRVVSPVAPLGPALPPSLQKSSAHERSPDDLPGPSSTTHSGRRAVQGPVAPPPQFLLDHHEHMSDISDDDDCLIGPVPDGQATQSEAHLELEKRALELKLAKFTEMDAHDDLVVRDEWMLELPEVRGVTDMGLTARQFRTKERPDFGDRSSWTDTPHDREHKAQRKKGPTEEELRKEKQRDAKAVFNANRDHEQEEAARKHKKKHKRDESLMDIHQKKLKKEKSKRDEAAKTAQRRPFSRDADLKVNRFDQAQKNAILKKAQLLDTRFGRGETKYL